MNVLVTGGAGFIGSHLVSALLRRGDAVRVLDDFSTGKRSNLSEVAPDVDLVEADLRDPEACRAACEGMDAVLHQAALGSVPRSVEDPLTTHTVNVGGTMHLLLAARERGLRRFIFASSSSVYGDASEGVKSEDLRTRPLSPYAVSKLSGEQYVLAFSRVYGLQGMALRYFNVFGPRQDPESMYAAVIPRFVSALLRGERPTVFGDGEQTRDFTYVGNVVDANLLGLEAPEAACGRAYNVGCGVSTSVNELFRLLRDEIGGEAKAIDPIHAPPQTGDVRHSLAAIDAAASALGYAPRVSVEEGIRRTVEWYRSRLA